ncbi:MAG: amino acid adenylation domain-containing protein [Anaerolineae bacterium]|nr:amino acid adenylation domain-containing protein [Anaerolineae bacterium]
MTNTERTPNERIAALSPEKRALLLKRLQEMREGTARPQTIPRRPDPHTAPLSFAQQRLWFLEQLGQGRPAYNMPGLVRIHGPLNVTALHRSLNEIIRRHEALRTTFAARDGELVQVIAPELTIPLPVEDLSHLPPDEREAEVQRRAVAAARRPFDLAQGPLMRVSLLRLAEEEHACLFVMHHIISDGWSMGVFRHELGILYKAFCAGQPSPLPELPIHYPDFALWQRRWLAGETPTNGRDGRGETLQDQLAYWRRQLDNVPVLELPTDRPRPPVLSFRGTRRGFRLSRELTEQLKTLSRQERVTLFMTLLAAFQVLLYRYSGQEDISVGTVVANRNRPEVEPIIGLFINTLVLRTDLSGDPTFRELLQRVRQVVVEAYAHQDVPFEVLLDELPPRRDPSYTPLFQALFILQNFPADTPELPGLELSGLAVDNETAKMELMLTMGDREGVLRGGLEYNTDLFDDATIERMIGHFQTLLSAIVADPSQRISALPLLTAAERHRLLVEWNDTAVRIPALEGRSDAAPLVHQLFEEQAARTPDAIAVHLLPDPRFPHPVPLPGGEGGSPHPFDSQDKPDPLPGGGSPHPFDSQDKPDPLPGGGSPHPSSLTYGELNRRANQLARALRRAGVGPETLVGLLVERSPDMIVGLLGILKAGGAYLPLDPYYPAERLAFMLEDAQVAVLLTQAHLRERLTLPSWKQPDNPPSPWEGPGEGRPPSPWKQPDNPPSPWEEPDNPPSPWEGPGEGRPLTIICLDTDWETIARESDENLDSQVTAANLAYVIYTSGSTGIPKGVQIEHGSLLNYVHAAIEAFELGAQDRVLQFASISFDAAAEEIFPTLACGARLVLRNDAMLSSVSTFLETCREQGLTVLDLPTVYWHQMVSDMVSQNLALPPCLRLVIIGGEKALPERLLAWHQAVGTRVRLLNTYGPTEATIVATMWELPATLGPDAAWREVPIGRPVANVQTYVLDPHLNPVPIGVPGELYIGGAGLARGYLHRPDLTAAAFIPHPFSSDADARLYRTGDLARYLPDGNLEFLGRVDTQVKVRGFRIELGEIEAVLSQHPAVQEAVVVAREDTPGDRRLVAYVVPAFGVRSSEFSVRHFPSQTPNTEHRTPNAELRRFLLDRLPDYMVPTAFVLLEELPKTRSGKVDRQALPPPDDSGSETSTYVAPRTPTEEKIAAIWADVLNVDRVGVHDSFFDLGGHSLLAIQVLTRLRSAFQVEVPLGRLFETLTVAGLAEVVESLQHGDEGQQMARDETARELPSVLVPIQPRGHKPPLFCVHPPSGVVFPYYSLARYLDSDQPLYGVQDVSLDGQTEPYTRVEDMAAHYVEAIRTVQPEGPYFLAGWSLGGVLAFEMAQQLHRQGQEVALLGMIDTSAPARRKSRSSGFWERLMQLVRRLPLIFAVLGESMSYIRDGLYLVVSLIKLQQDQSAAKPPLWASLRWMWTDAVRAYFLKRTTLADLVSPDTRHLLIGLPQAQRFLQLLPIHLRAGRQYVPDVYPGRVTLFQASERLEAGYPSQDPTRGWDHLAAQGVEVRQVPGSHAVLLSEPYVRAFAQVLQAALEEAQGRQRRQGARETG